MASLNTNQIKSHNMVLIPAGQFLAGEEKCPICIPSFYIAITPITNTQYRKFIESTGFDPPFEICRGEPYELKDLYNPELSDFPVVHVSWNDAQAYCKWAGLRLPTELEWEKAARGTDGRMYPWGDLWYPNRCMSREISDGEHLIASVDCFLEGRSPYGLLQMAGNIWEWCEDWYDQNIFARYEKGCLYPTATGQLRVIRGGSSREDTEQCKVTYRMGNRPDVGSWDLGFRPAMSCSD